MKVGLGSLRLFHDINLIQKILIVVCNTLRNLNFGYQ